MALALLHYKTAPPKNTTVSRHLFCLFKLRVGPPAFCTMISYDGSRSFCPGSVSMQEQRQKIEKNLAGPVPSTGLSGLSIGSEGSAQGAMPDDIRPPSPAPSSAPGKTKMKNKQGNNNRNRQMKKQNNNRGTTKRKKPKTKTRGTREALPSA